VAVKRWILLVLALALAAGSAAVWEVRANREQAARLTELSAQTKRLRARVADLTRTPSVPAGTPAQAPPEEAVGRPRASKPLINPEDAIVIQRLKLSLADANSSVARQESRADEADAQLQNLRLENKRLAGSEADLKENLAAANQLVDTLQKELKGNRDHVTQVEIAYQKLRDQSGGDAQKLAGLQQLAGELQDIQQRREGYLNGILRRYKQITEQYRSIAGVLQAQRTDGPTTGSADLARIQDSIAMAEEDFRQLTNLDAQARLIQKKMAGK
jgi:DNA repair exonuclease SbcCD ATPase subunit